MIFTTDAEISRRVFSFNDPETLLMAVHPSGKNILGESNLAFMHGPPHKAIRKSFLSLFTRKALATYVELQDGIIREHLKRWQQVEGEREIRLLVRSKSVLGFCLQFCKTLANLCCLWKFSRACDAFLLPMPAGGDQVPAQLLGAVSAKRWPRKGVAENQQHCVILQLISGWQLDGHMALTTDC